MHEEGQLRINQSFFEGLEKAKPARHDGLEASNPKPVLEELFELLEDYGPIWYTAELRRHVVSALVLRQQPRS